MATAAETQDKSTAGSTESGTIARRDSANAGGSDRGTTKIADIVVSKVAGIAAREVQGVHDLGGSASRTIGAVASKLPVGDERSRGVSVEVGDEEAAVDLAVRVEYGESIPRVADELRQNIIRRVEGTTGLKVIEVNIDVGDLYFPGDDEAEETRVQ